MITIPFENRYVTLGDGFYVKTNPAPVASPALIRFNHALADSLGISVADADDDAIAAVFSGNVVPEGAEPLAMAYAGHQFGHFVPQLGDGRAILLGEVNGTDGVRYDVQLKGSGRTYYSRNGDGRSALGPVLREYLLSEAMAKLNVPTTRALAAVTTGEEVARERLVPGGIITRIASSFVRVGTFQYLAAQEDGDAIKALADFVIRRNYSDLAESQQPYTALLKAVTERQARLIAQWMHLGFIHGVMNTDNMSIAGETIDYGPCAFMDVFDHNKVFSSIDRQGRYAYNSQPGIGLWNLTRFAETLVPLLAEDTDRAVEIAQDILHTYIEHFQHHWLAGMRAKCGLTAIDEASADRDKALIEDLLGIMAEHHADFTLTFFYLSRITGTSPEQDGYIRQLFDHPEAFDAWALKWRDRLKLETLDDAQRRAAMQAVNPVYIPRNHQVEAAIRAAEDNGDFSVFHALYDVLQNPFEVQQGKEHYQLPPKPEEVVHYTFCGT